MGEGEGEAEGGDRIDYLNLWCPAGPGYAHRWRRWGESRRDDGFVLRSGGIGGVVVDEEEEGGGGGVRGQLRRERYLILKKSHGVGKGIFDLWKKGTGAAAKGVLRVRCHHCKKSSGKGKTTMNEISSVPHPSRRRAAAVRKIVFETWSHQDYFGAVGWESAPAADDDDEEGGGGAQQRSGAPRVFCDVGINRMKGRDARDRAFSCWKGRIRRWRWRGIGNGDDNVSDGTDDDDGNDKDVNNIKKKNNNNEKSDGRHGKLISYKPFVLETSSTPRSYHPTYHINTWRWDDDDDNTNPNNNSETSSASVDQTNLNFPTAREFLRRIEVGDTIGVWGRVGKGETYHIIDAMRVHVFWAL